MIRCLLLHLSSKRHKQRTYERKSDTAATRFPKDSDGIGITAKGGDVGLHPFKGRDRILTDRLEQSAKSPPKMREKSVRPCAPRRWLMVTTTTSPRAASRVPS
jgi:hypothetical protein